MRVEAHVSINAPRAAVWAAISDIERSAACIRGIETVEVLERPASGLVGLRWRETRMLFGKPAAAEKWIVEATDNEFYRTRAEDGGFVFVTTLRLSDAGNGTILTSRHDSQAQGMVARWLSMPMLFLFRRAMKKAILQDLGDIKAAVERG